MIVEFWYQKKNCFGCFVPKWPKSLKNSQSGNVNEFLEGFKYFYQKVHIKIELRAQEVLETELWCTL